MDGDKFLNVLEQENGLAKEVYEHDKDIFDKAIKAWNNSTVASYFKRPVEVDVLAISYRAQVDKANYQVITNVLRLHYTAALSALRLAIDNMVISYAIINSSDEIIEIIKKETDTHRLDMEIKKVANRLFAATNPDLIKDIKNLKNMLNTYGPHPSFGYLGNNFGMTNEGVKVGLFDEYEPTYTLAILGCMLHGIYCFHEACSRLKDTGVTIYTPDTDSEFKDIKEDIEAMKQSYMNNLMQALRGNVR